MRYAPPVWGTMALKMAGSAVVRINASHQSAPTSEVLNSEYNPNVGLERSPHKPMNLALRLDLRRSIGYIRLSFALHELRRTQEAFVGLGESENGHLQFLFNRSSRGPAFSPPPAAAWHSPPRAGLFPNEAFQGQRLPIGGWENNVVVLPLNYVDGMGIDGSRAMQMTGYFQTRESWFAMRQLNPIISGNTDAAVADTVMSFDVKTDVPAPYIGVGLQS